MNVLQKYMLMWLYACNQEPSTLLHIKYGLWLLSRIDDFKELKDYIDKLEEPVRP